MLEILFEPEIVKTIWNWIMRSNCEACFAFIMFGGFLLDLIVMIYFLLPLSTKSKYRIYLAAASGIPVLTIILVFVFGFIDNDYWVVGSGEYLLMSIPFIISLVFFIYGVKKLFDCEKLKNRKIINIIVTFVGLFGWLWAFYISEAFMSRGIMGSGV